MRLQLVYKQVGLVRHRIEKHEDLGAMEAQYRRGRAQTRELQRLARVARGEEGVKRRSCTGKRAPRGPGAEHAGKPHGHDADDDELMLPSDEEGAPSEDSEMDAMMRGDDAAEEDWHDAVRAHYPPPVPPPAPPPVPDPPEQLPEYERATWKVYSRDAARTVLGRIAEVHQEKPSPCISVYCRRHGCSFLRTSAQAPTEQEILRWFKVGEAIPIGRTAELQGRHKALFPPKR